MPDLVPWLINLALVVLVGFLYWAERRYPSPSKPRDPGFSLTFCACCKHRAGEDCTHPESPVSGQPCGPVCIGQRRIADYLDGVQAQVAELKRLQAQPAADLGRLGEAVLVRAFQGSCDGVYSG